MWLLQVVQKNKYVIHYCEVCCVILYFFATLNFLEFCFSVLKLVHPSEIYSTLHLDMLLRDLCKYTNMGHDYLITLILFQLYQRKSICIWQTACKAGRQKVIMPKRNHRSSVNPGLRDKHKPKIHKPKEQETKHEEGTEKQNVQLRCNHGSLNETVCIYYITYSICTGNYFTISQGR